ncbi:MAG: hypothetical protein ABGX31_02215, partial [bacterium]
QRKPRVFRILFLDEKHNLEAHVAEKYASKAFPESGVYESAGWNVEEDKYLEEDLVFFMDGKGLDLRHSRSKTLIPISGLSNHFHVVVIFSGDESVTDEFLGDVPFRTTVLHWNRSDVSDMETLYQEVAGSVQKLLTILAGTDAK